MPDCSYVEAAKLFADPATPYLQVLAHLKRSLTDLAKLAVVVRDDHAQAEHLPCFDAFGMRRRELEAVGCELAAAHRHLMQVHGRLKGLTPKRSAVDDQLPLPGVDE